MEIAKRFTWEETRHVIFLEMRQRLLNHHVNPALKAKGFAHNSAEIIRTE